MHILLALSRYLLLLVVLPFYLMWAGQAYGHDLNFGVLNATEVRQGEYQISFRLANVNIDLEKISFEQAPNCSIHDFRKSYIKDGEMAFRWNSRCDTANPADRFPSVTILGLARNQQILVRLTQMDGTVLEQVTRSTPIHLFDLPAVQSSDQIPTQAFSYLEFGFEHIIYGYDHLMVVLCFVLFFVRFSMVFAVITGFTLGHSLSLILATWLHWQFPAELVEVFIVLSVIFMAREIYATLKTSILGKYPVVMSILIGLLHGLGFANAIKSMGLPDEHSFVALLFFNLGVELGQLLFVTIGMLAVMAIYRLSSARQTLNRVVSIGIGATSVVWLIQLT